MGEFPWQVRVGETVNVKDYVAPPDAISAEETSGEVVWSIGTYTSGKDVWKAFGLRALLLRPLASTQTSRRHIKAEQAAHGAFFLLSLLVADNDVPGRHRRAR